MTKRRPWYTAKGFIASGVLLFAVLMVTAGASVLRAGSDPATHPPARAGARVDESWGSRCGLPHGRQDPVVGPPVAVWQMVGHIAAPYIRDVGPAVLNGRGDRICYAHSPLGALLAAANFLPVTATVKDRRAALDHYVPSRLRDIYAQQPAIPVPPNTIVAVTGFKMTVLGRDAVNVTVALRINGVLGYVALPMRWTLPGDWRVPLLSTDAPLDVGRLDTLDGFIPWSA